MSISRPNKNKFYSLQNLSILFGMRFDPIKEYLTHSQKLIIGIEQDLKNRIDHWDKEHHLDPEIPDGFYVYEREILTKGEFRNILYHSLFIAAYSMFETEFKNLCEYAGKIQGSKLSPKDLSGGNYIEQCKKYIKIVLEVKLEKLNQEWEEITKLQIIRNSIAHNNGILKASEKHAKYFQSTDGITLSQEKNEIIIESDQYLMGFIKKLVNFLEKTIDEIINQKADRPEHSLPNEESF